MKEPKTIKGYLSMMEKIDKIAPTFLSGFDDLTPETQSNIKELSATISNILSDINTLKNEE